MQVLSSEGFGASPAYELHVLDRDDVHMPRRYHTSTRALSTTVEAMPCRKRCIACIMETGGYGYTDHDSIDRRKSTDGSKP